MSKCSYSFNGENITIKPDGVNELDPCLYETIETHENVTVEILRCKRCGNIEISWYRKDGNGESTI